MDEKATRIYNLAQPFRFYMFGNAVQTNAPHSMLRVFCLQLGGLEHDCILTADILDLTLIYQRSKSRRPTNKHNQNNTHTHTHAGVVDISLSASFCVSSDLLVDMLGVMASYSITVKELKMLFSMLRGDNGIWVSQWTLGGVLEGGC